MAKQSNCSYELPLVSIVIPAFNAADYLREAIDSVLNQSYPNIELIVLDDGSTDETSEILNRYPEGDFYRESHPNMGQAATLNKGWAMAKGKLLGYLSADDALFPCAVEDLVGSLEANPGAVMAYGDYECMDEHSRTIKAIRLPDFDYMAMIRDIECLPGPGVLWRRDAFQKSGGWDQGLHQIPDYDFWLRLGLHGGFCHVDEVLARFRVHDASQTCGVADVAKSAEVVAVIEHFFEREDLPCSIRSLYGQALANAYLFSAAQHLKAGRYALAWQYLMVGLKIYPAVVFLPLNLRRLAGAAWFRLRRG